MNPTVSVAVITYNHGAYIDKAIQSILEQQVAFPFEVVVGDDQSTDGTVEILKRYETAYPDVIRLLVRGARLGAIENCIDTEAHCRGDYIAWLEGDDYWLDPFKLQKQVEYLNGHAESCACFGKALEVDTLGRSIQRLYAPEGSSRSFGATELLASNFIPTSTILYRRFEPFGYPDWFRTLPQADWSRGLLLARRGLISYLPEVLAARRLHPDGLWGGLSHQARLERTIQSYEVFSIVLAEPDASRARDLCESTYLRLAVELENQGLRSQSLAIARSHLKAWCVSREVNRWMLVKLFLKLCVPFRYLLLGQRSISP